MGRFECNKFHLSSGSPQQRDPGGPPRPLHRGAEARDEPAEEGGHEGRHHQRLLQEHLQEAPALHLRPLHHAAG